MSDTDSEVKIDGGLIELKSEQELKEQLDELGLRFRFGCHQDKLPLSCHSLGSWFENYKRDMVKASAAYKHNCETHGYGESCLKYANCKLYGRGTSRDPLEAYQMFQRGCLSARHDRCCYAAGAMNDTGLASHKRNVVEAERFYGEACSLAYAGGCFSLGCLLFANPQRAGEAVAPLKKACDLGHGMACSNLGVMYTKGDGGLGKDPGLAEKYRQMATTIFQEHGLKKSEYKAFSHPAPS